ncbi:MAG: hypothetical protein HRT61_09990, partial [Ekhidna sp.]|nr:hypothetical protein [Ekhidna sp.]
MRPSFFMLRETLLFKAKECFPLLLLAIATFLSGCGNDEIQLPQNELEGTINGEPWSYKSANGYLISSNFQYGIRFLSSEESVSDPCTQPSPTITHVSAIFRPAMGSFFVAPEAIDNNQVKVVFEFAPGQSITATSGFMEVY